MENKSKYSVLTYLFLFLTIFVLIIFTKNAYYNVKENTEGLKTLKENVAQKQAEYEKLTKIKKDIDAWKTDIKDFSKYLINFSEEELTSYFYDYANNNPWKLKVESISLTPGKLNEFWFKEWSIDLSVSFATETDMTNMLNFLLESEKYNFFIHEFTFPLNKTTWVLKVNIPLKVLYK